MRIWAKYLMSSCPPLMSKYHRDWCVKRGWGERRKVCIESEQCVCPMCVCSDRAVANPALVSHGVREWCGRHVYPVARRAAPVASDLGACNEFHVAAGSTDASSWRDTWCRLWGATAFGARLWLPQRAARHSLRPTATHCCMCYTLHLPLPSFTPCSTCFDTSFCLHLSHFFQFPIIIHNYIFRKFYERSTLQVLSKLFGKPCKFQ